MSSDAEMHAHAGAHTHEDHHAHAHSHGLPHSHGGTSLRAVPSSRDGGTLGTPPVMSLLRLSLQARLGAAVLFAAIIWAATHWAMA